MVTLPHDLPDQWTRERLGDMGKWLSGGTPRMANPDFWHGAIPWVSPKDMKRSRLWDAIDHVTQKALGNGTRLAPAHSLLLVVRGMILAHTFPVSRAEVPLAFNQDIKALIPRDDVDSDFLLWWLTANERLLLSITTESTHGTKRVPMDELHGVVIDLPPLPEQRAIAAALSDVDALLEALTCLIAKKHDLKQAAMQQLLTGEKRLPGFQGKWKVTSLGELGSTYGGLMGKTKADFGEGTSRYVTFMNVLANVVIDCGSFERVKVSPTEPQNRVLKGDLLFNGSSETPDEVGMCAVLTTDVANLFLNSFCFGFRFRDGAAANSLFIAYFLRGATGRELVKSLAQGSTRYNLSKVALLNAPLRLPPRSEQDAISAILSDMDAELAALETRRAKTRALKQAMMQELLTGSTRLVAPVDTEAREESERTNRRQANVYFKRSVLAAEIIDRLHNEPTFGHVKFEKMIYLVEHLCDVDTGSTYHRDAAGPYDNRAIRSIDSQLRKQKWFAAQKIDDRYRYEPLANHGKHREYFDRYYDAIGATFDTVIETFRGFTTERCEIVATLFGAWRDLLQQNDSVSDDAIMNEVLNNWHKSKERIPEERWRKALSWMRDRGFVPRKANGV